MSAVFVVLSRWACATSVRVHCTHIRQQDKPFSHRFPSKALTAKGFGQAYMPSTAETKHFGLPHSEPVSLGFVLGHRSQLS